MPSHDINVYAAYDAQLLNVTVRYSEASAATAIKNAVSNDENYTDVTDNGSAVGFKVPYNTVLTVLNISESGRMLTYRQGTAAYNFAPVTANVTLTAEWTTNIVNVIFHNFDGTAEQTQSYAVGAGLITLMTPTREGYTFDGWFDNESFTGEKLTTVTVANNDIDLYAKWTPSTYAITYVLNGADAKLDGAPTDYKYGSTVAFADPTRPGYDFGGWFAGASLAGNAVTGITATDIGNKTFYAKWNAKKYTITVTNYTTNSASAVEKKVTVEFGGDASALAELFVRTYHTVTLAFEDNAPFNVTGATVGALDDIYKNRFELNADGEYECKLSATYTPTPYYVMLNGESGENASKAYRYGDASLSFGESDYHGTPDTGRVFSAWGVFVGGELRAVTSLSCDWTAGTVAFRNGDSEVTTVNIGSVTLYVMFANKQYTVSFETGVETTYGPLTLDYDVPYALERFTGTKEGYTFAGWTETQNGTTADYADGGAIRLTRDETALTLYAVWTPRTYTVSYVLEAGGVNASPNPSTYRTGDTVTLADPTRPGYDFVGWYDGDNKVDGIKNTDIGDKTFTAKWTAKERTLTFDTGIDETLQALPMKYDVSYDLPTIPGTKGGYTFIGWSWTDGGTVVYLDGAEITLTQSMLDRTEFTLYAVWRANTYSVTYILGGGTNNAANKAEYTVGTAMTLGAPTREGYTFGGWFDNESFTGDAVTGISATDFGNKTFYAKWVGESRVITYKYIVDGVVKELTGVTNDNAVSFNSGDTVPLSAPSKAGYTFKYWTTDESGADSGRTTAISGVNSDVTLYGVFEANTYRIYFNTNGGSISEQTVADAGLKLDAGNGLYYGEVKFDVVPSAALNVTLVRTGYIFGKWFASSALDTEFDFSAAYTRSADTTVYAKWTAQTYSVTVYAGDGTFSAEALGEIKAKLPDGWTMTPEEITTGTNYKSYTLNVPYGANALDYLATPVRPGSKFAGWDNVSAVANVTRNMAITAVYADNASVIFSYNGKTDTVTVGSDGKLSDYPQSPETDREGYIFDGWFTDRSLSDASKIQDIANEVFTDTTVLYAKYTPKKVTVTFIVPDPLADDGNDPVFTEPTVEFDYESVLDGSIVPTYNGYRFTGFVDGDGKSATGAPFGTLKLIPDGDGTGYTLTLTAQWEAETYTIAFDGNGGVPDRLQTTASFGTGILTAIGENKATRTGYDFVKWQIKVGDTFRDLADTDTVPVGGITLYASWTVQTFTVTVSFTEDTVATAIKAAIANNNKYGEVTDEGGTVSFKVPYNAVLTELNNISSGNDRLIFKKDGGNYNFDGVTENIALTAEWSATVLTVTLNNYDGNNNAEIYSYAPGTRNITLPVPTRVGYTFGGWFASGTKVETIDVLNENKVYSAEWTVITYTITYVHNGTNVVHGGKPDSYTVEDNGVRLINATRVGYTFDGWYDGENKVEMIAAGETDNRTFTARWTAEKRTLKFDTGITPAPEYPSIELTYDVASTLALFTAKREGYTFGGWSWTKDGAVAYLDGGSVMLTESLLDQDTLTLYAVWTPNVYNIMYGLGGGENASSNPSTYRTGDTVKLDDPTRTGYTFDGWYNNAQFTGTPVKNGDTAITSTEFGDKTFYAKWTARSVTIKYVTGIGVTLADMTLTYDRPATLTPIGGEKEGYTFAGWSTEQDGAVAYTDGATISLTADMLGETVHTLYAVWTPRTYSITYVLNGGENNAENPATYETGTAVEIEAPPARDGYTFGGWFESATFSGSAVTSIAATEHRNITLYAKWTGNEYSITYKYKVDGEEVTLDITNENVLVRAYKADGTTQLNNAAADGYTFLNWQTESGEILTAVSDRHGDLTLYGIFEANEYKIFFNPVDGNIPDDIKSNEKYTLDGSTGLYYGTVTFGTAPSDIEFDATRTGYTFDGWFRTVAGENKFVFTNTYAIANDITLYAKFTAENRTVTVSAGDGAFTAEALAVVKAKLPSGWTMTPEEITAGANYKSYTLTVTYGTNVLDYLATPERAGTRFSGWSVMRTDAPSETASAANVIYNVTATAQYSGNISVIFGYQGKTVTETADADGKLLSHTDPSDIEREGYKFDGWFDNESGGGEKIDFATHVFTAPTVLYAKYTPKTVTVTFDTADPFTGENSDNKVPAFTEPATPFNYESVLDGSIVPTYDGYIFRGWYAGDTPAAGVAFGSLALTESGDGYVLTLTARWEAEEYTVTFNTAGGSAVASAKYRYDATFGNVLAITATSDREGYTFNGWTGDGFVWNADTRRGTFVAGTFGDITLTAVWVRKTYTVTYHAGDGVFEATGDGYGDGGKTYTVTVNHGDSAPRPVTPTKTGYDFVGWDKEIPTGITADLEATAVFEVHKYTLYFDGNGGTPASPQISVPYGTNILTAIGNLKATLTGFDFDKWQYRAGDTYTEISATDTMPAGDVTVYAAWTEQTFEVTVIAPDLTAANAIKAKYADADITQTDSVYTVKFGVVYNTVLTGLNNITHGNDILIYSQGGEAYGFDPVKSDVELTAVWSATVLTVTLNYYDGNTQIHSYAPGTQNITLPVPTREGYDFDGWFASATFDGEEVKKIDVLNKNEEYFAKWTPSTYTIIYVLNGADAMLEGAPTEYKYGSAVAFVDPTRPGYDFDGWFAGASLTGNAVTGITTTDMGNKTFYAKWTVKTYAVTVRNFTTNTAAATSKTVKVAYGIDANALSDIFVRAYHSVTLEFTGEDKTEFTVSGTVGELDVIYDGKFTRNAETGEYECTLNAIYTPDNYVITMSGESGEYASKTYRFNDASLSFGAVDYHGTSAVGKIFSSWGIFVGGELRAVTALTCDWKNGEISFVNNGAAVTVADIGDSLTLYAMFDNKKYTVIFDTKVDGYEIPDMTLEYDTPEAIPQMQGEKAGYVFVGWSVTYGGTEIAYTDGGAISLTQDDDTLKLFAVWNIVEYRITYVLGGGTHGGEPSEYTVNDTVVLVSPTKIGYKFDGWFVNSAFTGNAVTGFSGETGNKTFYAKWSAIKYTFTFDLNGGTVDPSGDLTIDNVTMDDPIVALAKPTKSGVEFMGWSVGGNTSLRYQDEVSLDRVIGYADENNVIAFVALWSNDTFTYEFDFDGGISESSNVGAHMRGVDISLPIVTKPNFVLVEWVVYDNSDRQNAVMKVGADDTVLQGVDFNSYIKLVWRPVRVTNDTSSVENGTKLDVAVENPVGDDDRYTFVVTGGTFGKDVITVSGPENYRQKFAVWYGVELSSSLTSAAGFDFGAYGWQREVPTNAGRYIVFIAYKHTGLEDTLVPSAVNYADDKGYITVEVVIARAGNTVSIIGNGEFVYGADVAFDLDATDDTADVAWIYYNRDTGAQLRAKPNNVGHYTVKAVAAATQNYDSAEDELAFDIIKKHVTVTARATNVYGDKFDPTEVYFDIDGLVGDDELSVKLMFNEPENYEVGTHPFAVEYMNSTREQNYDLELRGEYTVTKRVVTVTIGDVRSYYGMPVDLSGVVCTPDYLADGDTVEALGLTDFTTTAEQFSRVGTYVIRCGYVSLNYEVRLEYGRYVVERLDVALDIEMNDGVYGGEIAAARVAGITCDVDGVDIDGIQAEFAEFAYNIVYVGTNGTEYNSTEVPVNAGSYSVEVSVRGVVNNYNIARAEKAFTIRKADNKLTEGNVSIKGWTYGRYDAEVNAPTSSAALDGKVYYTYASSRDGVYTTVAPIAGNVGTYYVRAEADETDNYNRFVGEPVEFAISKVYVAVPTLGIITDGESRNDTYTGRDLLATVNGYDNLIMTVGYDGTVIPSNGRITVVAFNAGTYAVRFMLTDTVNYGWADGAVIENGYAVQKWTVNRKVVTRPVPSTEEFALSGLYITFLPEGFDSEIMTIKDNVKVFAGNYTAYIGLKDPDNYVWDDGSIAEFPYTWRVVGVNVAFVSIVTTISVLISAAVAIGVVQFVRRGKANAMLPDEAASGAASPTPDGKSTEKTADSANKSADEKAEQPPKEEK